MGGLRSRPGRLSHLVVVPETEPFRFLRRPRSAAVAAAAAPSAERGGWAEWQEKGR